MADNELHNTTDKVYWVFTKYGKNRVKSLSPEDFLYLYKARIGSYNWYKDVDNILGTGYSTSKFRNYFETNDDTKLGKAIPNGTVYINSKYVDVEKSMVTLSTTIPESLSNIDIHELGVYETINGEDHLFAICTFQGIGKPGEDTHHYMSIQFNAKLKSVDLAKNYDRILLDPVNNFATTDDIDNIQKNILFVESNLAQQISNNAQILGLNRGEQVYAMIEADKKKYASFAATSTYANLLNATSLKNVEGFWVFQQTNDKSRKISIPDIGINGKNLATNELSTKYEHGYEGLASWMNFKGTDRYELDGSIDLQLTRQVEITLEDNEPEVVTIAPRKLARRSLSRSLTPEELVKSTYSASADSEFKFTIHLDGDGGGEVTLYFGINTPFINPIMIDWNDTDLNTGKPIPADIHTKGNATHSYVVPEGGANYTITITSATGYMPMLYNMGSTGVISIDTPFLKLYNGLEPATSTSIQANKLMSNLSETAGREYVGIFDSATELKYVVPEVFMYNRQLTSMDYTFRNCSSLDLNEGSISWFAATPNVTSFLYTFANCKNINSIPNTLFMYSTEARYFNNCFAECVSLESIPEDLFEKCTKVTHFSNCFKGCSAEVIDGDTVSYIGLTSIPENLFSNNIAAQYFTGCFKYNPGLTSIPENLFKNNKNATGFGWCFAACENLEGEAPELWNIEGASGVGCFFNCKKLSNYSSIPTTWGAEKDTSNHNQKTFSFKIDVQSTTEPVVIEFNRYGKFINSIGLDWGEAPQIGEINIPEDDIIGITGTYTQGNLYHTYSSVGQYTIKIQTDTGDIPMIHHIRNAVITEITDPLPHAYEANIEARSCKFLAGGQFSTLPQNFFEFNPQFTDFEGCFKNCSQLESIPPEFFSYIEEPKTFKDCFSGCIALTGPVPHLWEDFKGVDCSGIYQDCVDIDGYNEIPKEYGGGKEEEDPKPPTPEDPKVEYRTEDCPFTIFFVCSQNTNKHDCTLFAKDNDYTDRPMFRMYVTSERQLKVIFYTDKHNYIVFSTGIGTIPKAGEFYVLSITYDGEGADGAGLIVSVNGQKLSVDREFIGNYTGMTRSPQPIIYRDGELISGELNEDGSIKVPLPLTSYYRTANGYEYCVDSKMCLIALIKDVLNSDYLTATSYSLMAMIGKDPCLV
jgi:hypothetical protein